MLKTQGGLPLKIASICSNKFSATQTPSPDVVKFLKVQLVNLKSILLLFAVLYSGACIACPKQSDLDEILKLGNIYIGEIHGTEEAPEFYKCLITRAIEVSKQRVIVSLELGADAVSLNSDFWQRENPVADGRSSMAMFKFVTFILDRVYIADINVNLMYRNRAEEYSPELYAKELNALSKKGLVIAISGNAHASKVRFPFLSESYKPEGQFVASNFTHISLESIKGGTFWGCIEKCGIQNMPPNDGAIDNSLVRSEEPYYDYIYYLEKFTASLPVKNKAK